MNKSVNVNDIIGSTFGRLKIIGYDGFYKKNPNAKGGNEHYYLVECECGTEKIVLRRNILRGISTSCGCLHKELLSQRVTTHGKTGDRVLGIYRGMKSRCNNPKNQDYKDYGGRGIQVCEEWSNEESGFIKFYEWAKANGYNNDLTLDRIDVNGNYEPNNCRWATRKEQMSNTRRALNVVALSPDGILYNEIQTVNDFAKEHNLKKSGIYESLRSGKMYRGWTFKYKNNDKRENEQNG